MSRRGISAPFIATDLFLPSQVQGGIIRKLSSCLGESDELSPSEDKSLLILFSPRRGRWRGVWCRAGIHQT